jgi:hypothetical protein
VSVACCNPGRGLSRTRPELHVIIYSEARGNDFGREPEQSRFDRAFGPVGAKLLSFASCRPGGLPVKSFPSLPVHIIARVRRFVFYPSTRPLPTGLATRWLSCLADRLARYVNNHRTVCGSVSDHSEYPSGIFFDHFPLSHFSRNITPVDDQSSSLPGIT